MQSSYGASDIQRFVVDGSVHSTFFSISSAVPPNHSAVSHAVAGGGECHEVHRPPASAANSFKLINPFHRHRQHHPHKPPPPPLPVEFPQFHPIPITQQLFTRLPHPHHHQHHFQLFHNNTDNYDPHCHLHSTPPLLDPDDPENHSATGSTMPSFLAANVNFKLTAEDSSGSGSEDDLNNDNNITGGILHEDDVSESRLRLWQREEEDCAIKEPFWRPLDLDCINRNKKRRKEKEPDEHHFAKRSREADESLENSQPPVSGGNYKLFSELEAIYRPGNITSASGGGAYARNQTTGSGSALTGDEHLVVPATAADALDSRLDDHNSTGCEARQNIKKIHQNARHLHQRKKMQKEAIAAFFERLVKQLVHQQQLLHQKFINTLDRHDAERTALEEARREEEAALAMREAAARSHERALAAVRDATIVSLLEKISGETLSLPVRPQQTNVPFAATSHEKQRKNCHGAFAMMKTSRWPKAEVQALIAVRSGLEGRFQEPGLKGPLWEEVSASMSKIGYQRSAKRCKEKWENINKYFRKAKYSGRKRPQHSKTCPYFQQLDQLYSRPLPPSHFPPIPDDLNKNSDLLRAAASAEHQGFSDGEDVGESEGRMDELEEGQTNQSGLFNQSLQ